MAETRIRRLAAEMNAAAVDFQIGHLSELRARLRSPKRVQKSQLFDWRTIFDSYAFHVGGRTELQFNIGTETIDAAPSIRAGLAFSLEPSRSLPDIVPLLPKIARFNEFVSERPEAVTEFSMWHFQNGERSPDRAVGPIGVELVEPKTFIFVGRHVPAAKVDSREMLAVFDALLPLYRYVESAVPLAATPTNREFIPGRPTFVFETTRTVKSVSVDVALRHKLLQTALHDALTKEAGAENVCTEHQIDAGLAVDCAVRTKSGMSFYEVKVATSVQACVRAAIGQLLEYAYWPAAARANELVIVGEHSAGSDDIAYMKFLRQRFHLPISYREMDLSKGKLRSSV
jgi:hypothetical protein